METDTRHLPIRITAVWLFLRVFTSLAAAMFSPLYPKTNIETHMALWPPTGELFNWLYRVFVAPWIRWDAIWFTRILTNGYTAWDGTTSFHPLYIMISTFLYKLGLNSTFSLLLTSSVSTFFFFWIFYRLATLDLEPDTAQNALLLLAFFPVSFILFAPYTESTFLLLSALTLYTLRQKRLGLAALFALLATLTRQQGVFLALPLAWNAWESSGKSLRVITKNWRAWLAIFSAPLGLVLWGIYRIGILHEGSLDFSNPQGFIYTVLISPSANIVVEDQAFRWPWTALSIAVSKAIYTPEINVFINLTLGIGFLLAFLFAWKYLKPSDRLYSLAIILISFSVTTGEFAYISLPRHLLLAFPTFIGLSVALHKSRLKGLLLAIQLTSMTFLLLLYILTQWIP